ncbi:unnamed protein product [Symbiodinium natans]|uniref:Calmodulin n=1 Tax=Symbiodinium natans TaxID=878477 RepID=A0A812QY34_9DINO|nr:unnamed protein product [Symbiodinium natans]
MESMTEEEVEMYKGAFRPFDKDGTGATHADGEPKPLQATRENSSRRPETVKCILGSIAIADLGAVMKNLGRSCTAGEPEQQEDLAWHEVNFLTFSNVQACVLLPNVGQELQDMINDVDADGTGRLEFPDFLAMFRCRGCCGCAEEEIYEAFRASDPTGSGLVSEEGVRDALERLGERASEEELQEMLQEAAAAGLVLEGMVKYKEFRELERTR